MPGRRLRATAGGPRAHCSAAGRCGTHGPRIQCSCAGRIEWPDAWHDGVVHLPLAHLACPGALCRHVRAWRVCLLLGFGHGGCPRLLYIAVRRFPTVLPIPTGWHNAQPAARGGRGARQPPPSAPAMSTQWDATELEFRRCARAASAAPTVYFTFRLRLGCAACPAGWWQRGGTLTGVRHPRYPPLAAAAAAGRPPLVRCWAM